MELLLCTRLASFDEFLDLCNDHALFLITKKDVSIKCYHCFKKIGIFFTYGAPTNLPIANDYNVVV